MMNKLIFAVFAACALWANVVNSAEVTEVTGELVEHEFEANIAAMMDLIVNSLYTHREIFLRELISNSADALDKLRFHGLSNPELLPASTGGDPLSIRLAVDPAAKTLTVADNGIGMTQTELVRFLGSIAESGTRRFAAAKTAAGQEPLADTPSAVKAQNDLIGQFGVGFYSAYLVADHIDVISVSHTAPGEAAVWSSSAGDTYSVGPYALRESTGPADPAFDDFVANHGTQIVLHLRDSAIEELKLFDAGVIDDLATRYSSYLAYPIYVWTLPEEAAPAEAEAAAEDEEEIVVADISDDDEEVAPALAAGTWERVADVEPLWRRDPDEVESDEYKRFFEAALLPSFFGTSASKNAADNGSARHWTHFNVESASGDFRSVLYVPERAPIDYTSKLRTDDITPGVDLYVRRVYVASHDKDGNQLLPRCLNFVRGVVDADSMDIHVSRELIQDSRSLRAMRRTLLRKALDTISDIAEHDGAEAWGRPASAEEDQEEDDFFDADLEQYGESREEGYEHISLGAYSDFYKTFHVSLKACMSELRDDKRSVKHVADLLRFNSTAVFEMSEKRAAALPAARRAAEEARTTKVVEALGPEPVDGTDDEKTAYSTQKEVMTAEIPLPRATDPDYAPLPPTSLADYVARMPSWQSDVYAVFGVGMESVEKNPALEAARARGIEVLLCPDPYDEIILLDVLRNYDGHAIVSLTSESTELPENPDQAAEADEADDVYAEFGAAEAFAPLMQYLVRAKTTHDIARVELSKRLVSSPAVLVAGSQSLISPTRARLIQHSGGNDPRLAELFKTQRVLEINPAHPTIRALNARVAAAAAEAGVPAAAVSEPGLDLAVNLLIDGAALRSGFDVFSYDGFMKRMVDAAAELGAPADTAAAESTLRETLERTRADAALREASDAAAAQVLADDDTQTVMEDRFFSDEL